MTDRPNPVTRPWRSFAAWLLVGAAYTGAVIGILSIGVLLLPIAIAGTVLLSRRTFWWPEESIRVCGVCQVLRGPNVTS